MTTKTKTVPIQPPPNFVAPYPAINPLKMLFMCICVFRCGFLRCLPHQRDNRSSLPRTSRRGRLLCPRASAPQVALEGLHQRRHVGFGRIGEHPQVGRQGSIRCEIVFHSVAFGSVNFFSGARDAAPSPPGSALLSKAVSRFAQCKGRHIAVPECYTFILVSCIVSPMGIARR